ncbi:MAG: hypothetical protein JW807_03455 [Spirochaetes bacterium]|nr:hypothetical protein [Spirochaetota bacterium]
MPSKPRSAATRKKKSNGILENRKNTGKVSKIKTKKVNLLKLYSEMNKLGNDAVDKEVIKRFKVIIDTCDEDITKKSLAFILKEPKSVIISDFSDSLQPYIKHYLFLNKRNKRIKKA